MRIATSLLLCGFAVSLSACQQAGPDAVGATAAAETADSITQMPDAGADEAGAAVLDVVSPGKPQGPISVSHEPVGRVEPGVPFEIVLTVAAGRDVSAVSVQISMGEGLYATPDQTAFRIDDLRADEPATHTLTVTPVFQGRHRISIVAAANIDGQMQAATHTIDVSVGTAVVSQQAPSRRPVTVNEDGEAIILLPAE